jgi:hypothetical protein
MAEVHTEGGAIIPPFKEVGHDFAEVGKDLGHAAEGIGGTIQRWALMAWDGIKHAFHWSKEQLASAFPLHHGFTAGWIGLTGGAGALGLVGAVEFFRRRRKKKKAAEGHGH